MQIYLPIAEISVNVLTILALGGATGVLSGMFGVGGGFLMTPLLIFLGIAPAVAVASAANQIIAASVSGFLAHWRRNNVDFKMGGFLLIGGLAGSSIGVWLFNILKRYGQIDLTISLCYVAFLGGVGALMAADSLRDILHKQQPVAKPRVGRLDKWRAYFMRRLPWQIQFPRSSITISAIIPGLIGFLVGVLVSLMGIGGGFFLIPAMIYLLGMPTSVVIGTSLFQIIFITANVTFLQALTTQTVDVMLALLLLTGSVVGAQLGTKIGSKLPAEHLRGMLALLVLIVALKLAYDLFAPPANIYSIVLEQG